MTATLYSRTFDTPLAASSFRWSMRTSVATPNGARNFAIGSGVDQKAIVGFQPDGTLVAYDGTIVANLVLISTVIAGRNYRAEAQWDAVSHPNLFRVRIDNGDWTGWLGTASSYSTMDAVFIEDDATSSGDFYVDAFNTPAGTSGIVAGRWLLGARIYLNSGTQYHANDYLRTPTVLYAGDVLNFGYIERSIDAPAAPPRVGDCLLRIADTNQEFRALLATQTGMRRLIELVRVSDNALIGGFELTEFTFGDGYVEVRGSDILSRWRDRPIPTLGTRENFAWMGPGIDEFFMPIIAGIQFSSEDNPQGMIKAPHMGPAHRLSDSLSVDRYSLSRHTLFFNGSKYCDVYRKLGADPDFSIVDPAEYVITIDEPFDSDGQTYTPTYLDFLAAQDLDAQIRFDAFGFTRTPSIGGLPTFESMTTDPLRNPMDLLTLMLYEMIQSVGGDTRPERYSVDSFLSVRDFMGINNYLCNGAIVEPMTMATFLSLWQASFETQFYANRHYQQEVALIQGQDFNHEVLTDLKDFVAITPIAAQNPINRVIFRYGFNPATGEWAGSGTYDNTGDQAELGNVDYQSNIDQVESENVDFRFVSDHDVSESTAIRRSTFRSLGSYRAEAVIPTPLWFERMELSKHFGLTHYGGIGGPWVDEEFVVLSIRHDLSQLQTTVGFIRLFPVEY